MHKALIAMVTCQLSALKDATAWNGGDAVSRWTQPSEHWESKAALTGKHSNKPTFPRSWPSTKWPLISKPPLLPSSLPSILGNPLSPPIPCLLRERQSTTVYLGQEQRTEAWQHNLVQPKGHVPLLCDFPIGTSKSSPSFQVLFGQWGEPWSIHLWAEVNWSQCRLVDSLGGFCALVNNATGNRSCDHLQSVCPSTLTLQGWAARAVLSHWRSIISWYFWEESGPSLLSVAPTISGGNKLSTEVLPETFTHPKLCYVYKTCEEAPSFGRERGRREVAEDVLSGLHRNAPGCVGRD